MCGGDAEQKGKDCRVEAHGEVGTTNVKEMAGVV